MTAPIETPEAMAERLWFAVADADVTPTRLVCMEDAIRARDKQIAEELIAGHDEVADGQGSGRLCELIGSLGFRWNETTERWERNS